MSRLFVVVENEDDWSPYYPSEDLVTFDEYLQSDYHKTPARVINFCHSYEYLSKGYYCSLLAESRGDKVIPSLKNLGRFGAGQNSLPVSLPVNFFDRQANQKLAKYDDKGVFDTVIYFGKNELHDLERLFRKIFERYEFPIQKLHFQKEGNRWFLDFVKPVTINELSSVEQDDFANYLEISVNLVWRKPRKRKKYKYDLAILVDPEEKLPPSNKKALKNFQLAGHKLGIESTFISKDDYSSIAEYDGLFIRETTAVNHHTFKFAQKAEEEGIIVVDDPGSILKCTNKVFLSDLFERKKIPTPATLLFSQESMEIEEVVDEIGFPAVLKIPDGAFSKGVYIVKNKQELKERCQELFKKTHLLIAQEFLYTEYDWRIGIFGNKPLFACQYFMVRGHWQVYNHKNGRTRSGGFKTVSIQSVPRQVIKTALNATGSIGKGLYGVDIKQKDDRLAVIEVNDNPNIDADIEDQWLGKDLYHMVMQEFLMRMERNHYGY